MAARHTSKGVTLIEVLVTAIILAVLLAVALPLYLESVAESERTACKSNMKSVASAVQAQRTRTKSAYYSGPVDAAAVSPSGPLRDLENALPHCPADLTFEYAVTAVGDGFEVSCGNPIHTFKWKDGSFVP